MSCVFFIDLFVVRDWDYCLMFKMLRKSGELTVFTADRYPLLDLESLLDFWDEVAVGYGVSYYKVFKCLVNLDLNELSAVYIGK